MFKTLKNSSYSCTSLKSYVTGRITRNLFVSFAHKQEAKTTVLVEKDSNITLIGLNREHSRNSIDESTSRQLSDAFSAFETDISSPVAVLYGVGGSFSAGFDLKEVEEHVENNKLEYLLKPEGFVGPTRRHFKKPVVCGINGYCVANGLELSLMCDFRVMEESAIMGFFNRHCGIPIIDGGTVRLPKIVGLSRSMDLITTGRRVSAKEALKIGLINRLVATGTSLGQAVNLAFSIAKFPNASLQHDRNNLYTNTYNRNGLRVSMQNETLFTSKDVPNEIKEGVERFRNSQIKGSKTCSFDVKPKNIPAWEAAEAAIEERYAAKKAHDLLHEKKGNT